MDSSRADGLTVGAEFWVAHVFDQGGYFRCIVAPTRDAVLQKTAEATAKLKLITAASIPFKGTWNNGTPDVTMPPDFKAALASIDKPSRDD